jgi:hypothetical protein
VVVVFVQGLGGVWGGMRCGYAGVGVTGLSRGMSPPFYGVGPDTFPTGSRRKAGGRLFGLRLHRYSMGKQSGNEWPPKKCKNDESSSRVLSGLGIAAAP